MSRRLVLPLLQQFKSEKRSAFALLIDPEDTDTKKLEKIVDIASATGTCFYFVGGSLMVDNKMRDCVASLRAQSDLPVVIFPGNPNQVVDNADAVLFLSLISGRNPDLLIGQQVVAAPQIIRSGLEVIATGYMIMDGGVPTTVSYMSHSLPIPADKPDIALCTAWAGQLLGKHVIYMDAGSGALNPIPTDTILKVSENINIPLIVGGGIRTPERVQAVSKAGAQVVVVGNAIEKDIGLFRELASAIV